MWYTRCWFHKSNSARLRSQFFVQGGHDASHAGVRDQLTHVLETHGRVSQYRNVMIGNDSF
jgi:hypothetical protein